MHTLLTYNSLRHWQATKLVVLSSASRLWAEADRSCPMCASVVHTKSATSVHARSMTAQAVSVNRTPNLNLNLNVAEGDARAG